MPTTVACQCGAKFAAQDRLAGKTVRCPRCSQPLHIPERTSAANASASPPTPAPAHDLGDVFDDVGLGTVTGVRCPQCGSDTPRQAVLCVKCGFNLKKMRQQKVEGDRVAQQRRERILEQQRRKAEAEAKKRTRLQPTGGTQVELGGVTEAATAILRFPTETFQRLSPVAGTKEAYEFAFSAAIFIGIYWLMVYSAVFFLAPLQAQVQNPELAEEFNINFNKMLPYFGKGLAAVAGMHATTVAANLCIFIPAMAGVSHFIMKFVGESKLDYFATLRVLVYTSGACWLLAGLPCIGCAAPIVWLVNSSIGLSVHHRVSAGVTLLAVVVGLFVGWFIEVIVFNLLRMTIIVLFVDNALPKEVIPFVN